MCAVLKAGRASRALEKGDHKMGAVCAHAKGSALVEVIHQLKPST